MRHLPVVLLLPALWLSFVPGCDSGMQAIDRRTLALLDSGSTSINASVKPDWPIRDIPDGDAGPNFGPDPALPATRNPDAREIAFQSRADDPESLSRRLTDLDDPATAITLDLRGAIAYAIANGREYQDAAESYVIASLQLLIERHLWGPRFFDEVRATATADGDAGLYDAALSVVTDFTVRQRLPYGGEVSASLLARATEDLNRRVSDNSVQSAEFLVQGDIPLLRGAGLSAREDRIQAERNLIYAAREFERFRRFYVFEISREYLDLVVQKQAIDNAQRQLISFEQAEARERALFEAGRQAGFQAALAVQDTLFSRDRLAAQKETYRLAVDRFKIRIGMPAEENLAIEYGDPALPTPRASIDEAVVIGLQFRLDLQNQRDQFDDTRRRLDVARNQLLPDLSVFGSASVPTDPDRDRAGLRFSGEDTDFVGGVAFDLPLDREIERARLRQAQIALEQAGRTFSEARDRIAVEIRSAVRQIDRALFSIRLQEENVRIAALREASIDAAPDRASPRDRSDAIDARLRAEDGLAEAKRDLQVAVLGYLLSTDQLRVDSKGQIIPLEGMTIGSRS